MHGRVQMLTEIMERCFMGNADGDMAVAEQPEGTLLTATEEALAAKLETPAPEDA